MRFIFVDYGSSVSNSNRGIGAIPIDSGGYDAERTFSSNAAGRLCLEANTKQLIAGMKHIRGNQSLIVLLVSIFCYGLYSEGIDRLYELYILEYLEIKESFLIKAMVFTI